MGTLQFTASWHCWKSSESSDTAAGLRWHVLLAFFSLRLSLFSEKKKSENSPVVHAHALSTSTNTNIDHTSLDLVGDIDNSLQTGRALSVERSDSGILREPSNKGGSAELGGTGAGSKHIADGDILNEGRVDLGALENGLEDASEEVACGCVLEGSLAALGEGGAAGGGDDDLLQYIHISILVQVYGSFRLRG